MSDSTKILLKRTQELLKSNDEQKDIQQQPITFGEPLFIDNNTAYPTGSSSIKCNSYLAIGSPLELDSGVISNAAIFKGFFDISKADSLVFFKRDRENPNRDRLGLVDETNQPVYADKLVVDAIQTQSDDINSQYKYYLLCQPDIPDTNMDNPDHGSIKKFVMGQDGNAGIYISSTGVLYGAAWNDYAEKRVIKDSVNPGSVVCEVGDGSLISSSERLQVCPYVVSDTFGMVIGNENDIPVAVSGRALVNIDENDRENISIGDCVCAGPNGKALIMTREEIKEFPDRILGIVTGIPLEETWNGVDINNRVWIKIK